MQISRFGFIVMFVVYCKRLHSVRKKTAEPDFIYVTAYIKLVESKTIVNSY